MVLSGCFEVFCSALHGKQLDFVVKVQGAFIGYAFLRDTASNMDREVGNSRFYQFVLHRKLRKKSKLYNKFARLGLCLLLQHSIMNYNTVCRKMQTPKEER